MEKGYKNKFTDPQTLKKIAEIEGTGDFQEGLNTIKKELEKRSSGLSQRWIIMAGLALIMLRTGSYIFLIILIGYYVYSKNTAEESRVDINGPYADKVLLPILQAIFPGTSLGYLEGIDGDLFQKLLPKSEEYDSNCHIIFADQFKTEFCNMQAYHYTINSKGDQIANRDFAGQVMMVKWQSKLKGHIRIVPLIKKGENYQPYGSREAGEGEIKTESIDFNGSYAIFSTDDFYTKLILDPSLIEIFNDWSKKMKLALYMDENFIALAYDSNSNLFSPPSNKKEVEGLFPVGEYGKVQDKLADFYDLIHTIREKL